MQKKKGISLIVLVITIIVMIILAAAIILSLNNAGIIGNANKAVAETNLSQMKDLASMSWGTAYADGARTLPQLKEKINPEIESAVGEELDNYEVTVGLKGITVVTKKEAPEEWKDSVTIILDGVPIPKGFVASKALGENTRDEGFVIYEGTEGVEEINDENVEWAKKNINQYVWIPVYDFDKFGKGEYNIINAAGNSSTIGISKLEKRILVTEDNMPDLEQGIEVYSQKTLNEAYAMYQSVKKYGGFYVARYEAGTDDPVSADNTILEGSTVRTMQNKYPYTGLRWGSTTEVSGDEGGAVQVARSIYNDDSVGVVSTMMYLPQWYRIGEWIEENNASVKVITGDINNAYKYGNTYYTAIGKEEFVDGAQYLKCSQNATYTAFEDITTDKITASSEDDLENQWILTTGSTNRTKLNNIYDLIGNVAEYDMYAGYKEGEYYRRTNGAYCGKGKYLVNGYLWDFSKASFYAGFRVTLYIK